MNVVLRVAITGLVLTVPLLGVDAVPPAAMTVVVDQPAYIGEPVWITATSGPTESMRYPFHTAMEDTGCNRIELSSLSSTTCTIQTAWYPAWLQRDWSISLRTRFGVRPLIR